MFYSLIAAFVVALLIALVVGPLYIPLLRRLKAGQAIREEGPQSHYKKAGTPTMGGVIFLTGILAATLLFAYDSAEAWLALAVTFGHAGLGFADDFIKVVLKRNLGRKFATHFIFNRELGQIQIRPAECLRELLNKNIFGYAAFARDERQQRFGRTGIRRRAPRLAPIIELRR